MKNQEESKAQDPAVEKALEQGRNANDNFNEGDTDSYGLNEKSGDGASEKVEREQIKGGTGQHGTGRNRNDDFENEKEKQ